MVKKEIFLVDTSLGKKEIVVTVDKGKRKHLYLSVQKGEIILRAPQHISDSYIREVIQKKADWIIEKGNRQKIPTKGESLEEDLTQTKWLLGKAYKVMMVKDEEMVKKAWAQYCHLVVRQQIEWSLEKYCKLIGLHPTNVTVKKMKRSWGRCSSKGTISFNEKLACYPVQAIDYVVLHELCHLRYMNHSKEFYQYLAKFMSDYKAAEALLKN